MHRKLVEIVGVDFDAVGQQLIIYSAFVKYLREKGNIKRQHISYFKTSIQSDSVRKVLHNILNELGIPIKLAKPIKMCLNETYCRVQVGKHFCDTFPIQNDVKQGAALTPLFLTFLLSVSLRGFR